MATTFNCSEHGLPLDPSGRCTDRRCGLSHCRLCGASERRHCAHLIATVGSEGVYYIGFEPTLPTTSAPFDRWSWEQFEEAFGEAGLGWTENVYSSELAANKPEIEPFLRELLPRLADVLLPVECGGISIGGDAWTNWWLRADERAGFVQRLMEEYLLVHQSLERLEELPHDGPDD